jgi:hypothetical protein
LRDPRTAFTRDLVTARYVNLGRSTRKRCCELREGEFRMDGKRHTHHVDNIVSQLAGIIGFTITDQLELPQGET